MSATDLAIHGGKPVRDGKETLPYTRHFISDRDSASVLASLSGSDISGKSSLVDKFEEALSDYTGFRYVVVTNSATSALRVAYEVTDFHEGAQRRVTIPALTFVATANMLGDLGYDMELCDVDDKTLVATSVDVGVSYAGYPIESPVRVCDDAHSLCRNMAGNAAKISVLSFHPAKHITTGEGGAVLTNSFNLFEEMAALVDQGRGLRSSFGWGYNFRMPAMNAALGLEQLKRQDINLSVRTAIAETYSTYLSSFDVKLPAHHPKHSWHLYVVRLPRRIDRDFFVQAMRAEGIGVQIHYPPLCNYSHLVGKGPKIWIDLDSPSETPVADEVSFHGVSLPIFPKMNGEDLFDVYRAFEKVYEYASC